MLEKDSGRNTGRFNRENYLELRRSGGKPWMPAELITWHRFIPGYIPFVPSHDRIQIRPEHGPQTENMGQPANDHGPGLKRVRVNRNSEHTVSVVDRENPPRHGRHAAAASANLQIVADPVNPLSEFPLEYPATEVVNLIP